jgi:hypothetical protein
MDLAIVTRRILRSHQPAMIALKAVLAALLAWIALSTLRVAIAALYVPELLNSKDFLQDYLMARATLVGINPYLLLTDLAQRFMGSTLNSSMHPSPHPPAVALLMAPLGRLTYQQAATVWFMFEVACLLLLSAWFMRTLGQPARPGWIALLTLVALATCPFADELLYGQLMIVLLILFGAAWHELTAGRELSGGALLGCAIGIKLLAWPLVLYLVLRRQWRAVGAAVTVALIMNLAAGLVLGLDRVLYYYLHASSAVFPFWRSYERNFSLWTIGWRFFEGMGLGPNDNGMKAPPLLASPALAPIVSYGLPLAFLALTLVLALRARHFDTAFGMLTCTAILISPVAWGHYLVLATLPLLIAGRRLCALRFPRRETWFGLVLAILLLMIPRYATLHKVALLVAGNPSAQDPQIAIPFVASMVSLLPAAGIVGLWWLCWRLDSHAKAVLPSNEENIPVTSLLSQGKVMSI